MTCAVYTALVIFGFLLGKETKVGNVGMAITQVMLLLRSVQYGMRNWTNLDNQMISVERILEYSELKQEIDDGGNFPPEPWPSEGNIELQSVSMRYSPDNPMVLQNVSFKVRGGEKVGIVGRTGAGKTSLISTLFRLFDFNGTIAIDGVDIKSIPLKTLRSKISIVPQDPVLFLGTLRKNLDPFNKFTDLQIWNALEDVGLKEVVADLPLGLKYEISESGSNFSVGQKQLLCLVRTMLRKAKIVVLDEATANVDLKTDKVIQSAIRRRFRGCTVLTIAHRLSTIMDSDRILVMNNGRVREFDQARKFMEYSDGFPCNFVN
ncbi:ABC tran domain containing protein [Asbolus verrucosus]|uniref:ABC tran domain containing protein n=1 Tax=Asbolus verrucosus TaxID=1661398 RepID=A0A482VFK8_ASBVE|nr:ABC tran domain containing protein [Asbolus verrucosus]